MEQNKPNQTGTTLTIIWLAMAQSHLIFAFVSHFILAKSSTGTFNPTMAYVLFGIAGASAIFAWVINQRASSIIKKRALNPEQKNESISKAFPSYIISWALCETVSIIGLFMVVTLGAQSLNYAYILFVAGISLHLLLKPKIK